ncbi:hypothetical protein HK097_001528 [Rhizophlyctis rosea]|uniref:Methyltransferase domain-containing protein n=1 Tax=Rhizophlyctis rosea TaxID=64517 RepID=A0AAD5SGY2_9FUNG|nr:hypothetical protein HK097_001528 [Rhizophlyctis rosea]
MSPVQPSAIKPKNVDFMVGDLTKLPLPFEDGTFDYVHMRLLNLGLHKDFWPTLISEITRVVKPGGHLELMEIGRAVMPGPTKFPNLIGFALQGAVSRGIDSDIAKHLKYHLESQPGLTNVQEVVRQLQTCPDRSDASAVRIAKLYGDDLRCAVTGSKAPLVAPGLCKEEDFEGLVKAHVGETLSTKHEFDWVRCFAMKGERKEE